MLFDRTKIRCRKRPERPLSGTALALRIACRAGLAVSLSLSVGCHPFQTAPAALTTQVVATPAGTAPVGTSPVVTTPPGSTPTFVAPAGANSLFQSPQLGQTAQPGQTVVPVSRGVFVPVTNEDFAWEQIVDVVDNYFRVDQENRVQVVGNVLTEGRIDTFPQVGSTILEPHQRDSVGRYNRVESTFQSIRRRAEIRVIPQQGGYFVEAIVLKELEDLPRPENSTAGAAAFRNDNSLHSRLNEQVSRTRLSNYWIPLGRDCEVEIQLLEDIHERLTNPPQQHSLLH